MPQRYNQYYKISGVSAILRVAYSLLTKLCMGYASYSCIIVFGSCIVILDRIKRDKDNEKGEAQLFFLARLNSGRYSVIK